MTEESLTRDFYSQTGVCLPLPVSSNTLPGHRYSLAVLVVLNTALLVLVLMGQGVISMVQPSQIKLLLNKAAQTSQPDQQAASRFFPSSLQFFSQ